MSIYCSGYDESAFEGEWVYHQPRDAGRDADDGGPHDPARSSCGRHRVVDALRSIVRFPLGSTVSPGGKQSIAIYTSDGSAGEA